tara:strand:- start:3390 stop:3620 length:231 start_codon:yes stop_codon:yes gene_type:complete
MSEKDNKNTMNPVAFEAFLKELSLQMADFNISSRQTADFFNEAIRTVKSTFPNTESIREFDNPEEDDRPWIDQDED